MIWVKETQTLELVVLYDDKDRGTVFDYLKKEDFTLIYSGQGKIIAKKPISLTKEYEMKKNEFFMGSGK